MCRMVSCAISDGNEQVISDIRKIQSKFGAEEELPKTPEELCSRLVNLVIEALFKTLTSFNEQNSPYHLSWVSHSWLLASRLADEARMRKQSSQETRSRANKLAERIRSYHMDVNIDDVFDSQKSLLAQATGFEPHFSSQGGSTTSNLALQNIQARFMFQSRLQDLILETNSFSGLEW